MQFIFVAKYFELHLLYERYYTNKVITIITIIIIVYLFKWQQSSNLSLKFLLKILKLYYLMLFITLVPVLLFQYADCVPVL